MKSGDQALTRIQGSQGIDAALKADVQVQIVRVPDVLLQDRQGQIVARAHPEHLVPFVARSLWQENRFRAHQRTSPFGLPEARCSCCFNRCFPDPMGLMTLKRLGSARWLAATATQPWSTFSSFGFYPLCFISFRLLSTRNVPAYHQNWPWHARNWRLDLLT